MTSPELQAALTAVAPLAESSCSSEIKSNANAESILLSALSNAAPEISSTFRPAAVRAARECDRRPEGGETEGRIDVRLLSARFCAYAGMLDALRRLDGGMSAPSGEGGDLCIQLTEWIYGYRLATRGSMFAALKAVRNEKTARKMFIEMDTEGNNMISYDEWCDYLEAAEVKAESELGMLFEGRADAAVVFSVENDGKISIGKANINDTDNVIAEKEAQGRDEEGTSLKTEGESQERGRENSHRQVNREPKLDEGADAQQKISAQKAAPAAAKGKVQEKARREADDKALVEAEELASKEVEEKDWQEAEERARQEEEQCLRKEAEKEVKRVAEEKACKEAEELAKKEAKGKCHKESEERERQEEDDQPLPRSAPQSLPPYLYDPGPTPSPELKAALMVVAPLATSSPPTPLRSEDDVNAFLPLALSSASPEVASIFRPAADRAASGCGQYQTKTGGLERGIDARLLSARFCAYAGMLDAMRRLDGGISAPSGEGGDLCIQLSEWIYGYRLATRGSTFAALKAVKNEEAARKMFIEMDTEGNNVIGFDEWCNYIEAAEVRVGSDMGMLFDGRADAVIGATAGSAVENAKTEEAQMISEQEEKKKTEKEGAADKKKVEEEAQTGPVAFCYCPGFSRFFRK